MTKLPLLSLPVLTAIAMAAAPAMTSHAATVRTYRIPAGINGSSNNGNCDILGGNNQLNNIIQSVIGGNGNQNSLNQFCENWNKPDCDLRPNFPGNGGNQPAVPGGDSVMPELPGNNGTDQPATPGGDSVMPELPGGDQGSNTPDSSVGTYAARVLELVNEERAKAGVAPLTLDTSAQAAADTRAREIKSSFSHTRPNGSSFSTALTEAGVNFRASGENIAYGQKSPEAVMNGWMNSSGHRANILNKNFTSIGIGHYQDGAGVDYWTQLFFN